MRIGQLSQRTGTSTRALRYYEQQRLIVSRRLDNGYRDYDELAVTRVNNIKLLLDAGMSTRDIAGFGSCLDADLRHAPVCAEALANIEQRMRGVEERMEQLADAHRRLAAHLADSRTRALPAESGAS